MSFLATVLDPLLAVSLFRSKRASIRGAASEIHMTPTTLRQDLVISLAPLMTSFAVCGSLDRSQVNRIDRLESSDLEADFQRTVSAVSAVTNLAGCTKCSGRYLHHVSTCSERSLVRQSSSRTSRVSNMHAVYLHTADGKVPSVVSRRGLICSSMSSITIRMQLNLDCCSCVKQSRTSSDVNTNPRPMLSLLDF